MGYKADSGQKFDQGRIQKILALANELSDLEYAQLVNKLSQSRRPKNKGSNEETIQL